MFAIVGHCPKCGCPIYSCVQWHGVCPPPSHYSCQCHQNETGGINERVINDKTI